MMSQDEFWEHEFGRSNSEHDFAGRKICKKEYGKKTSYGWTVDHIMPLSLNGSDTVENCQITHYKTNEEKADKTTFESNGRLFQVKKMKNVCADDTMAQYPYKKGGKKYGIVILEE
jgi:CRISPR/Cas system Type II protein with McrA/HNH and RuvC-like nuclease domain